MTATITYIPQRQMLRLHHDPATFANACRANALTASAKAGCGHLGGSFSCMDILAWLYLREMRPEDVCILSKGHAALAQYATLHGLGRISDADLLTFRDGKGGLPAHPCIETPGIACNTGSLGMGISKAKGMIFANRLQKRHHRLFVILGDGEMQEGQVWEALMPHAVSHTPDLSVAELTVIVDSNRAQGSGVVAATRDLSIQQALASFDWIAGHMAPGTANWRPLVIDGHSIEAMTATYGAHAANAAWSSPSPVTIIARTIKGAGVSFMENDPSWHSRPLTQQEYETALAELLDKVGTVEVETIPHVWPAPMQPEPLVAAYGAALLEMAERYPELVVLDADLAKEHGLLPFKARYPNRFFECGIAEQDMVGIASGMVLRGLIPVVHSHAAFLTRRALDQVHNQTTEGTHVVYVGGSAGKLQPNGNGKSHETLIDGTTMALLGMEVYEPREPEHVGRCLARALEGKGSAYIRLLKQPGLAT